MHAVDRAKERYGVDLTAYDILEMQKRIRAGEAAISHPKGLANECIQAIVKFNGQRFRCIYRPAQNLIVTIYPIKAKAKPQLAEYVWRRGKRVRNWRV